MFLHKGVYGYYGKMRYTCGIGIMITRKVNIAMKIAIKCLNLSVVFLMIFAGTAVANEWYESMESSGLDQSHSVWKNISTSGSATQHQDVKQAIAEIAESVMKESAQIAESASVRELDASHLSGAATPSASGGGNQQITANPAVQVVEGP